MANDLMRGGPRGSSDQVAWMGPVVVPFTNLDNVAGTLAGVNFDASAGNQTAVVVPSTPGTTWQLDAIVFRMTETYGALGGAINIGTTAPGGLVDDNAFVAAYQIPNTTAENTSLVVPLNGVGANLDPTIVGNENFAITSAQWLRLFDTGGASAGRYVAYAVLFPVAGYRYSG
jgi:hypothetical protein